ncbi:MAG: hypothetical protein H6830_07870 [Planctomycetes bacterium]|nr:hypothetical protein [Planctomycetota bacterium]MCB9909807.1 hypothetical protein [Planctomycetota bacterium]MCB9912284.1 hypothetical protein [Planctomycetota bacterium]HPF14294.1 beta-eliminating lyase-related protein [Planctomycetota bacterium]HRV79973.1 beta-eliminating lyase-related protein [Planctomycetota bacterium]
MQTDLAAFRKELRQRCQPIHGDGYPDVATELARVAAWCKEVGAEADVYGRGEFVETFEAKLAGLFGMEAARFLPSGTMAQGIAMRIWCQDRQAFGMHPTSHLELHEERGYSQLFGLEAVLVGPRHKEMLAEHLASVHDPLAALLMELPTRENGGRLPNWEQLEELCALARSRSIRLHLDGARIWQAQAAYGRSLAEIGALFDSIYVSFYKDVGALPGAMLMGSREFLDQARLWQRRMGGNLYTLLPNVASAASRLDGKLTRFAVYRERALALAEGLSPIAGLRLFPDPPQASMMHVLLDLAPEAALFARDRVAEESGLWLFGAVQPCERQDQCRFELSIGEAATQLDLGAMVTGFRSLLQA